MNTTKFDVSPFLLLEVSADSDGGCTFQVDGVESIDGDDESCSASLYEPSSCKSTAISQRQSFDPEEDRVKLEERIFTSVEEEDEDDGEGEVNSYGRCGISQFVKLSVDSTELVVISTEMDESRMFWEACLAS
ncbi:hypothetical protein N665_0498s0008 [Sinapis alba]|nr:hypothetical protein N665_0498s0008 [Sinapis alba]